MDSYHVVRKNGIQKINYMRAEFESYDGAGEWLFMQQCHAKVQVWKIANFQDQVTRTDKKNLLLGLYMYRYILLRFHLTCSNL